VLPQDCAEFQVLSYQMGIAHTTGYPIYILLSKLFLSLLGRRVSSSDTITKEPIRWSRPYVMDAEFPKW